VVCKVIDGLKARVAALETNNKIAYKMVVENIMRVVELEKALRAAPCPNFDDCATTNECLYYGELGYPCWKRKVLAESS
jgi:hypothetical protein